MTSLPELIASLAVLLLCSLAAVSLLSTILSRTILPCIKNLAPLTRLPVLSLLLCMPFFATLLLAIWGSAPARWAYAHHHCDSHAAITSAACSWHLPQVTEPALQTIFLLCALLLILFTLKRAFSAWRTLMAVTMIKQLASFDKKLGVWRLPIDLPMAYTAGLLRPGCFISEGLLQQLNSEEIAQICAHEHVHAERRDGLRQLLMQALSWGHLPGMRRYLLNEWELATEQTCDETVARQKSERFSLAQTLIRVARLQLKTNTSAPAVCYLTGGELQFRVQALLHPATHRPMMAMILLIVSTFSLLVALGGVAPVLHQLMDWL